MIRKICVVTGTRAEYGLLQWVMREIQDSPNLSLQLIVTGMHLSHEFGLTYQEIEKDGFHIDRSIEMLLSSDSSVGIAKSMGLGLIGFSEALDQLKPDILLVLGDRFEIFSAVSAALIARIPVAHLHGGETTEGAFDESIRHSITKMSHVHFVATNVYRQRVIQLGEHPDKVFDVGGLGLDNLRQLKLLERNELESELGFDFFSRNLLITFHPVTLENATAAEQVKELLAALMVLKGTRLIFTFPNADTYGREITTIIKRFVDDHPQAKGFTSLGQLKYLSCLKYVDGVVGNSSSGLIEAPYFCKGTINIGDRQRGRLKADSVIDCEPNRDSITAALNELYSAVFQERLKTVINPYGEGGASKKIVGHLQCLSLKEILKKRFYDVHFNTQKM